MEFSLEGRPHIELNKLLKFIGWCESGGEANSVITNQEVTLDGNVETRKRCKLKPGHVIVFQDQKVTITE